jgi:Family of unknown function (DUF5924)/Protein of unknown function (DUF2914)
MPPRQQPQSLPPTDAPAARRTRLDWLKRWGISVFSLGLGLATLFVFRRGLPHVGWIVGYLLLLVLLVAAVTELRQPLERSGRRHILGAADYAIQSLYHGLLLFVLPAYYASATLDSLNALFLAGVVAGALVTAVDPWYVAVVHPRRWLNQALLGFSIFVALNVALPLLGIRPILALEGAAALTAVAMMPVFRERGALSWRQAYARSTVLAVAAMAALWLGRAVVPPAPLFVASATAARSVTMLEPVEPVESPIPAQTVAGWGGIAAYTAVYAPAGLRQPIEHVWWKDGQLLGRVPLSPLRGGRKEGFRTYSRKTDLKPPYEGRYRVDVVTASGQLIGRLRFTVTP